jgi:hypothetical protein
MRMKKYDNVEFVDDDAYLVRANNEYNAFMRDNMQEMLEYSQQFDKICYSHLIPDGIKEAMIADLTKKHERILRKFAGIWGEVQKAQRARHERLKRHRVEHPKHPLMIRKIDETLVDTLVTDANPLTESSPKIYSGSSHRGERILNR